MPVKNSEQDTTQKHTSPRRRALSPSSSLLAGGCALAFALTGLAGCDPGDVNLTGPAAAPDPSAEIEREGNALSTAPEEQPVDEEALDPARAREIARIKKALRGGATGISPQHAFCGRAGPNLDGNNNVRDAANTAARQRNGSTTDCPALGVLQLSDDADYHCFTFQANSDFTWTYLRNLRTGVRGWVRDDLLDDRGSFEHCGF
jgi:hypothetical protein